MDAAAVIPVWNRRDLLARLLDTLCAQTAAPVEVVVVDNGSTDGAPELAAGRGARVIRMGANAGFAAAVNRGIQECRAPLVAVLNSDVELAPGWLESLAAAFADPDVWFATGKIFDASRRDVIDGSWDAISRAGCPWRVGSGRADGPPLDAPRGIRFAPWTAAVFRTALFERAGLLDEAFESYLEDVDFGLRCASLGLGGAYVPGAVAWHRGSATLGRWHPESVRRMSRNQVLLVRKHYPRRLLLRWAWAVFVGQALWGLVALRHGAGLAWLRGKVAGLRGCPTGQTARIGPSPRFARGHIIAASEREIREIQRGGGFDLYWRLYFLLTGEAS